MRKGFFIYSNRQQHARACIESILDSQRLNSDSQIEIRSIKGLFHEHEIALNQLTSAIDSAGYICIDLTGMEDEILFATGYAIGRRKDLFVILDKTFEKDHSRYRELSCLRNVINVHKYSNADDIYEKLNAHAPWEDRSTTARRRINKKTFIKQSSSRDKKSLLYLKSHISTEFSRQSHDFIKTLKFPYTIDDPAEFSIPGMQWYVDRISEVPGVFIELSSRKRYGARLHNAKCSIVGGLALGLNRSVFLIVEEPYASTIDYQGLLNRIKDPNQVKGFVAPYISQVKDSLPHFLIAEQDDLSVQNTVNVNTNVDIDSDAPPQNVLEEITFGSFSAENEEQNLHTQGYYYDIWNVDELISKKSILIVGRKGVGKTAILKVLEDKWLGEIKYKMV